MANHALLNNAEHQHLRVRIERGAGYGDAVMSALTYPGEFRDLQGHYPIVFAKNADGAFDAIALFGFEHGENLFLGANGQGWDAPYIPFSVERQPFLIGRGADPEQLMIHVDMDSPRLTNDASEGESLFLSYGGTTEYMERIGRTLRTLHDGLETAKTFSAALVHLDLLESFVFDIELDDGSQNRLAGFYIIQEERLAALTPEQLGRLHAVGYLQAIYMAVASLSQFRALIDRKNRKQRATGALNQAADRHAADR